MYLFEALGKSITGFLRDEGFYLSASISYFLIVALVPLSLLIVSLFGHLLGHNQEFYQYALARLIKSLPLGYIGDNERTQEHNHI